MKEKRGLFVVVKRVLAMFAALVLCTNMVSYASAEETKEDCTLLFEGAADEFYQTTEVDILLNADDDDVFTIVYSCTDASHAGWGILGWRGTVDGAWVGSLDLNADATDATAKLYSTVSVKSVKDNLGITDNSVVDNFALGAWNGGKIEALYLSSSEAVPTIEDATEVVIEQTTVAQEPEELTGDYLYVFNKLEDFTFYFSEINHTAIIGRTMTVTVELEGNGNFGGALGTCVSNWVWSMENFSSDENNTATVTWYLTPSIDNMKVMLWWNSGTQVGIKSISIKTDINWDAKYAEQLKINAEAGNGNAETGSESTAAHTGSINPAADWNGVTIDLAQLLGDVPAENVERIDFTSGSSFWMGFNDVTGAWYGVSDQMGYSFNNILMTADGYNLLVGHGDTNTPIYWEVFEKSGNDNAGSEEAEDENVEDESTEDESAEDTGLTTSVTLKAEGECAEASIALTDLLCGLNADQIECIRFTGDVAFKLGYGITAEPWWEELSGSTTYDVDLSRVQLDPTWYALKVFVFENDGNDYTISWEAIEKNAAGEDEGAVEYEEAYTGNVTCNADWSGVTIGLAPLLGNVAAEDVAYVSFTAADPGVWVGYNNQSGVWYTSETATAHELNNILLTAEGYNLQVGGPGNVATWKVFVAK